MVRESWHFIYHWLSFKTNGPSTHNRINYLLRNTTSLLPFLCRESCFLLKVFWVDSVTIHPFSSVIQFWAVASAQNWISRILSLHTCFSTVRAVSLLCYHHYFFWTDGLQGANLLAATFQWTVLPMWLFTSYTHVSELHLSSSSIQQSNPAFITSCSPFPHWNCNYCFVLTSEDLLWPYHNIWPLSQSTKAGSKPLPRSLTNKTFIFKGFFCSPALDILCMTENWLVGVVSVILPGYLEGIWLQFLRINSPAQWKRAYCPALTLWTCAAFKSTLCIDVLSY